MPGERGSHGLWAKQQRDTNQPRGARRRGSVRPTCLATSTMPTQPGPALP